jgi:hypothetical protein
MSSCQQLSFHQLTLPRKSRQQTNYTDDDDRYLLYMFHRFGPNSGDVYEKLRSTIIHQSHVTRFNWFLKSRTTTVSVCHIEHVRQTRHYRLFRLEYTTTFKDID